MESSWLRSLRGGALLLVLPLLAGACVVVSEGPELPTCATTVTWEPTGDLAEDLVGAWSGNTNDQPGHHPIAYMGGTSEGGRDTGLRIWMFREEGTGHVWWKTSTEDGRFGNDEEFIWEVVDGELVVNDLPPATLEVLGDDAYVLHPADDSVDPSTGVVIHACDLEVPEGVEGFDA